MGGGLKRVREGVPYVQIRGAKCYMVEFYSSGGVVPLRALKMAPRAQRRRQRRAKGRIHKYYSSLVTQQAILKGAISAKEKYLQKRCRQSDRRLKRVT